jgi:hypothetical protein
MSDTEIRDLLDRLAASAPEPAGDPVADVYRRIGTQVRRRRRMRRLAPVAVALATVVALLGTAALVGALDRSEPVTPPAVATSDTEVASIAAARQFATTFFTFDYRQIGRFTEQVTAGSTGEFQRDFVSRTPELARTLNQVQSVATARVVTTAAREVTPGSARVLSVVDQEVRNRSSQGKPVMQRYRVAMDMRLVDGRWLASGVSQVEGSEPARCADTTATPDRDELLRQTCAATERLFEFDYRTLDADLSAQRAVTTGPFTEEIQGLTGPNPRSVSGNVRAHVGATASEAAVVRQDETTATVLVFLNQTVRSDALDGPRIDRNRLELSMTRVGERWLVSDVNAL